MRRRLVMVAAGALVVAAAGAPFAGAQDVTQTTATVSALPLDGARSLLIGPYGTVALNGPRTGMTGTLGVHVVESARSGNATIRVKVSSSDLVCGAVTVSRNALSVSSASTIVGYIGSQTGPLGTAGAVTGGALGDGAGASTPRDIALISGEDPGVAYTTAVTPHVATATLTFVVPNDAPAQACAGTLTYDMLYV